jgi:hypothetical protein
VALLGRMVVILVGFVFACVAAALVMTLGILAPDFSDVLALSFETGSFSIVVGLTAFFVTAIALLPAFIVILVAEAFGFRSILFYGMAGAGLALAFYYTLDPEGLWLPAGSRDFGVRGREVLAASGILAGFVYWAFAGRNAGRWRETNQPARTSA